MKITNLIKIVFVLVLSFSTIARAENEAGVVLGTATGFTGLIDLGGSRAFDLGLAYKSSSNLYIYGDYLFTNARSFNMRNSITPMTLYYGLGVRVENLKGGKNDGKTAIGPRAPIGLHYKIINPDVSLFGELAMTLDVVPETNVEIAAGIGFRIRF